MSAEDGGRGYWVQLESDYRAQFEGTSIAIHGQVRDLAGRPVAGATIDVAGATARSTSDGRFEVAAVPRANALMTISHLDYRDESIPLHLHRPVALEVLTVPPVLMTDASATRTLFGGDVQLGRRFVDTLATTARDEMPKDDPEALIQVSDPLEGTKEIFRLARPLLSEPDFTAVNLESVVTDDPATPSFENRFVFFSLPGSLPAIPWSGIDYVSLANNHIYDYLEQGLSDTIAHLTAAAIPFSGAGEDIDQAFEASRHDVRDHQFSIVSMVSIEGVPVRNATGATEDRSGAADLNDDARIVETMNRELAAGRLPIASIHTGYEYMERPPDDGYTAERLEFAADAGAKLVVAHHPHMAQGFQWRGDTPIAHSLGNLVFDQDRIETMLGLTLLVDWQEGEVANVRGRGVHIDAYSPRPVGGVRHDFFARKLAEASQPWGTTVAAYNGFVYVLRDETAVKRTSRSVELEVVVGPEGFGIADFRNLLQPSESVAHVQALVPGVRGRIGRDIMVFGDMEDMDVDDDVMEVSRWYYSGYEEFVSTFRCQHDTHHGAVALCAVRNSGAQTRATIPFRNRLRVLGDKENLPNKDLSVVAYTSRHNAGPVEIEVTYHASFGGLEFGAETLASMPAGSSDWQQVAADVHMPADSADFPRDPEDPYDSELRINNPRSLRVFFHHSAPASGEGILRVDDVAVVAWQEAVDLSAGANLVAPHPRDFVRVEAAPGTYRIEAQLDRIVPIAAN